MVCFDADLAHHDILLNAAVYLRPVDGVMGTLVALGDALVSPVDVCEVGILERRQVDDDVSF